MFPLLPRSFTDVAPENLRVPGDPALLQQKMSAVQQIGSKIHRLQQEEDYEGAMSLYSQFHSALADLLLPPHQFYVIARRSFSTCLWVMYGNKVRRRNQ